jgi:hypothetical protein
MEWEITNDTPNTESCVGLALACLAKAREGGRYAAFRW